MFIYCIYIDSLIILKPKLYFYITEGYICREARDFGIVCGIVTLAAKFLCAVEAVYVTRTLTFSPDDLCRELNIDFIRIQYVSHVFYMST